jgi:ParB-like chromosome segregation protein Spo0J
MPTTTTPPTTTIPALDLAITATGFRWRVEQAFSLDQITGKIQHRHDDKLNAGAVRRYRMMAKAGSNCPPIGVTRDGYVLFGNHRIAAYQAEGRETIPAVVIDVDGAEADTNEFLRNSLLSIATRENAPHGVPYSGTDRSERAKTLLNLGYTNARVQAELGLSASSVSGLKREVDADQRFVTLGLDETGIPTTVKRALAGPDAKALNTEPFRELVDLAREATLTPQEVNAIAKEAKDTGSDVAALRHVEQVRRDMADRITSVASTGSAVRPTPVGKLRGALRGVTSLCEAGVSPSIYRDHTDNAAETKAMVEQAIKCLTGILAVQEVAEG